MRIAFVGSRGFPGVPGGVEKSLEQIAPRLAAKGHEMTVYVSAAVKTQEATYRGVRLKRIPAIPSKHLETVSRTFLASFDVAAARYDIAHYHSIGPALLSWIPRLAAERVVVTVHGLDWQRAKWGVAARKVLQLGERAAAWFPHHTVVVSRPLLRHYRETYPGRAVSYIPNGVTLHEPVPAAEIAARWGLRQGGYVLFASRLVPEKGCHTLIEAFNRVRSDKKLAIAGASWHSDEYVERLKRSAADNPNIVFVGWAEGRVLDELFSNAYLYCLPSEIEGLSLSLLDGMGYGLCPLVSNIPENREVVGEAGAAFAVRDAEDLRRRLQELLDDAGAVRRLGDAAREAVRREYDWDVIADSLEALYLRLAGKQAKC